MSSFIKLFCTTASAQCACQREACREDPPKQQTPSKCRIGRLQALSQNILAECARQVLMLFAVLQAAALAASCCSKHVLAAQLRFTVQAPRLVTLVAFFNCPAGVCAQVAGCPPVSRCQVVEFPEKPEQLQRLRAKIRAALGSFGKAKARLVWSYFACFCSGCCQVILLHGDELEAGYAHAWLFRPPASTTIAALALAPAALCQDGVGARFKLLIQGWLPL